MKPRWYQQLLSVLLVLALLVQLLPLQVLAKKTESPSSSLSEETVPGLKQAFIESEQLPTTVLGEVESLRTETEKHFRMSDGSYMAVSYGIPVHYQDEDGAWLDIDNTMSLTGDKRGYRLNNKKVTTTFAANLNSGSLLTASYDGTSVSMSLLDTTQADTMISASGAIATKIGSEPGGMLKYNRHVNADIGVKTKSVLNMEVSGKGWTAADVTPKKLQSSVLYEDVFYGVDLLYTAYGYNIKEQIIVNAPQSSYRYDYLLELDGVEAVLNEDGSVSLVDDSNEEVYYIPVPFMADSKGIISYDVSYSLSYTKNATILTVEADAEWMNDEARAYPVAIDPTINVQAGSVQDDIYTSYVAEGAPDTSYGTYQNFYLGYTTWNNLREYRGFAHFNELPTIPSGAVVTEAMFGLYMHDYSYVNRAEMSVGVYEVTEEKPDAASNYHSWIYNLTWNTMPDYDTTNIIDYTVLSKDAQDQYYYWDISELVKKWYAEETNNRTIAMAMTAGSYSETSYAQPVFYSWGQNNPPVLLVSYRSILGIEDYYSYASLGAGAAGTAYISDYTGQLTVAKGLVSYASSINPFAVSLVYNSNYNANNDLVSDYPSEEFMQARIGEGWTLDVLQMVELDTIGGNTYLKYRDGDGSLHYFSYNSEDSTFYDEDGLGLSVKRGTDTSTYFMTDSQDNTYTFVYGLLREIKDNNGNQYNINFTDGKLTSITQKNNGATEATTVATFAYTGDYLTSVTDAAGLVYTLNYTYDWLTSISLGDTVVAEYAYYSGSQLAMMTDSESGYTIRMAYNQQDKICAYTESAGNDNDSEYGAQVWIAYNEASKTTYTDYGNDRKKNTSDDIITHYLFDYSGRTVNAYTTDADGNVLGADTATYFDGSEVDKRNNRTIRTASIGAAAEQELLNGGFEDTSNNTWTGTASTTKPRTGAYSLESIAVSGNAVCASKASRTLYAGTTYTFSGYVNTTEITTIFRGGIYLMVEDAEENVWCSEYLDYQTSEDVDDGWIRIAVTFTAEVTGVHTVSVCCAGAIGTFYADDLQLERGAAPSNVNLLQNGNFQESTTGWTLCGGSFPTTSYGMYRKDEAVKALAISSNPSSGNARFYQEVPLNLSGEVTYVLSGWAMGNAVPDNLDTADDYAQDTEKTFGLRAIVNYSDDTKEYFYTGFNSDVSDWQFTSLAIVPSETEKAVTSITVECAYEKNANLAAFDNISLVRETVQTMSYDDDGNLTSVSTTGVTSDTNTYEDGNLIETVTGTGSTYTYTYDETYAHRLISYTDGATTQTMDYDNYGNVILSVFSSNGEGGLSLRSDSTYDTTGNRLMSESDVNNILTTYQYSTALSKMMGAPTLVLDGNNTPTVISYDEFGRTSQTTVANLTSLSYNYSNGNLSSISREDSNSKTQEYVMYYDSFGNMTALTINDGPLTEYEYAPGNGQLLKQTYGNGATISYAYDNLGRLATATYSDGRVVTYTYDGDGQLYSVREVGGDSPATYLYTYDSTGNLIISEKKDEAGDSLLRVYLSYDSSGQLVGQSWYMGNSSYSESYTYNTTDGSLNTMVTGTGDTIQLDYDELQRLTSASTELYTKSYSYHNLSDTRTTTQVSQVQYTGLPTALTYGYTYDADGNIATYSAPGKGMVTYTYDALGQLLSAVGDETYTYSYDSAGNILTANGHTYAYGMAGWQDLLTAFDGETITYDAIANPLSYYNGTRWTFTWENGRSLATATDGTTNISYSYDANGLRTTKTVGDSTHYYYYASGQLLREYVIIDNGDGTADSYTLDFFYDASGYPYALKRGNSVYYYITNLQGDVMYLVDADGSIVASYEYDPYGNIISATGSMANLNPLRYRGYYYDTELEMYYLQSRYYDPQIGRFINADSYASTGQGVLGCNMFAYCANNPINCIDSSGQAEMFLAEYIISQLCAALADMIFGVKATMVSIKAAIKASFIPAVCIVAAAVGVTAISYVFYQVYHLMATAQQAIKAVKAQIQQKKLKESQLKNYTVYAIARKGTTDVVYVGITKSYSSRQYTHQRKSGARFPTSKFDMVPIATNLSYKQARALEQTLICAYGIDTLYNMINSISPKKWGTFVQEFNQMATLIESYFDSY